MPKLDGKYLFRDYETTLQYVKIACDNTVREQAPLYALWLLSEKVEDLANLFDGDLGVGATSEALRSVFQAFASNVIIAYDYATTA